MLLSFERSGAGSISTGDCGHHGNDRDMNDSTSVELSYQRGIWNLCVRSRAIVSAVARSIASAAATAPITNKIA
jgi:hypothetical protein